MGVDPGLRVTGYGLIDGGARLVDAGVIRTTLTAGLQQRLEEIADGIDELLAEYQPRIVAVENLYAHYRHPRTAIVMGHARGVILLSARRAGVPVVGFAATRIKKALTNVGRAGKQQVARAVARELGLRTPPQPADVSDALAIALCCAYEGGART